MESNKKEANKGSKVTGEERGEECGLTGGSRRTLAAIANDGHGTNDIVVPCAAALLNSEQVIFLLIIEDVVRALVARHVLYEGCFNIPVLKPVMLLMVRFKLLPFLCLSLSLYVNAYLSSCLKHHALQSGTGKIHCLNEVPEQRAVLLVQLGEIIVVDV